jgi:hypothetical protein
MNNTVTWDVKTQFVLRLRHITSPLQNPASSCYVTFQVFTAVTMNNSNFWDVTPCGSCENRSVSEERVASIVSVKRISELGTA